MSTSIKDLSICCTGVNAGRGDYVANRRRIQIEIGNFDVSPAEKWTASFRVELDPESDAGAPMLQVILASGEVVAEIPFQKGKSSW